LGGNWGWPIALLGGLAGFLLTAYLVLKLAPDWFAETDGLGAKGRSEARQGVRTASLALLAGTLAVIGAIYTARTFALNRAGQLTDRFTRAIEQLGHKKLDVRLGGIYALERIAEDSKRDRPQVVEVLTAYVREHARRNDVSPREQTKRVGALVPGGDWDPDTAVRPATDVQAALTVLVRRKIDRDDPGSPTMDLSYTNLRGADLRGGNSPRPDSPKPISGRPPWMGQISGAPAFRALTFAGHTSPARSSRGAVSSRAT
jgi:hypothetical protein